MSTTSNATGSASNPYAALSGSRATTTGGSGAPDKNKQVASEERFLKLLVAQMQNQDPLNPMDNAQVTSQMAQINAVTSLEKVNTSIAALSTQMVQMQALQGASLVGRDVVVAGNRLSSGDTAGRLAGGFEMDSAADHVQVEILDGAGRVLDTLQLGAQTSGRHAFGWTQPASVAAGATFRVTASSGTNKVGATALTTDRVEAVSTSGQTLQLQLSRGGIVGYDAVKAFN
ncbi:flagellar hook assembly protein FlgD [Azohydromonas aeria]|uniref:flagellar hook assembly protein FlgD n=1 Tax=Azohydromonas aeria TaxID=2590212 RepID=UPI0012FBA1E1|nr:flagellar hook capping FlgD N-terminal domain-containing protein [Azohydromonas aeria]